MDCLVLAQRFSSFAVDKTFEKVKEYVDSVEGMDIRGHISGGRAYF
jgi:hypothetical protein